TRHLTAAQNLIKQNTTRSSEYPEPLPGAKAGEVFVRRWKDLELQVQGTVAFVEFCVAQGIPPGDILVMTPCRPIGQDIRKALVKSEIEAQSYFSEELMEEPEAQQAFTVLALLVNKYDRIALRTWLGSWLPHQEATSYKYLRDYCEAQRREPWDVLEDAANGKVTVSKIDRLLARFVELQDKLKQLSELKGQAILDNLFPEGSDWADDIRTAAGVPVHEDATASDLYDTILEAVTQPTMPEEVSHVRIMSLHKAKGLTAAASAIVGAMEGLTPRHWDAEKSELSQAEHLEEQRRLFYVAMTRSTDFLLVASCREVPSTFGYTYQLKGTPADGILSTTTSRFVSSLGEVTGSSLSSMDFTILSGNVVTPQSS
ncbi:MAG: ATP-dependent helicase, partial [Verrucomicrobiaceae bacterium]